MSTKFSRKTFLKGSVAGLGMMALNVCTAGAASAAEPAAAAAEDTNSLNLVPKKAASVKVTSRGSVSGGWQGVFVTVLQWTAVLLGILYKTLARRSIPALSLTIYLVMGWTAIFFLPRLIRNASLPLLLLILLGGVLYTAGAIVYAKKGFRYHHLVWHLFIDLALLSHLAGIVFFIG